MSRRLNVPFLIKAMVAALAVTAGAHFLHAWQMNRHADTFLELARASAAVRDKGPALFYFQSYLSLRPDDALARAEYALALDDRVRTRAERQRAARELEKALSLDPGQAQVRQRLALNLIALGRPGDAVPHVEKLLASSPSAAELEHILGWCLEATRKYALAAEAFARAARLDPKRVSTYELWADVLLRVPPGEEEDAEAPRRKAGAVMDALVAANPKDPHAYLARSRFHARQGDADAARRDIDQAAHLAPDDAAVILAQAQWRLAAGDVDAARTIAERGTAAHPGNEALIKTLAGIHVRTGDRDRAADLLRAAVERLPDSVDLAILLIDILIEGHEIEEARGRLAPWVARGDAPALCDYLSARLAVEGRDWSGALKMLERVRQALPAGSPWQGRAQALLGVCALHLGDVERAGAAFRRAMELEPGWPEARLGLAGAHFQAGRLDEALTLCDELLAEQAKAPRRLAGLDALAARALLARTLRQPEKARNWEAVLAALKRAETHDPASPGLPLLRAQIDAARGEVDRAEAELAAGRLAHPEEAGYWLLAAEIALRQGKPARAQNILLDAEKKLGPNLEVLSARVQAWVRAGADDAPAQVAEFKRASSLLNLSERAAFLARLAAMLARLGEPRLEASVWRELATLEGGDPRSRAALVDLALAAGDLAEARSWLEQLRAADGDEGVWLRSAVAAILIHEGRKAPDKLREARKVLDRLATRERDWARLALLRARLEEASGHPEAALAARLEAARLGDVDVRSASALVRDLFARKRFLDADAIITRIEESMPLPLELGRLGVDAALALGNLAKARERALVPGNLASGDARVLTWLVRVHHALGDDASALAAARRAVALHPRIPDAWIALLRQLVLAGRREEALNLAEEASRAVAPAAAVFTRARCLELLGDWMAAEAAYRHGMKEDAADFVLAAQAAEFLARTDQRARAVAILTALLASEATPRDWLPRLRRQLALALAEAGEGKEALAQLDRNGKPGSESPANARARALVLGGDARHYKTAQKLFDEAHQREPAQDDEIYELARMHERAGQPAEAAALLEKLVLHEPENPQWLGRLVLLLASLERRAEAQAYLERLERVEPGSPRSAAARKAASP